MKNQISEHINNLEKVLIDSVLLSTIENIIDLLTQSLSKNLPLLVFGNGGSAADALHITGELVGKFNKDRSALNVICLNTNSVVTSAWSNDFEYETVFARQVQAHGKPGGIAWGLSTSGNSKSVLLGLQEAQKRGMTTIGMTGNGGGLISQFSNFLIAVPSNKTPRIQEIHLPVYHYICEQVEINLSLNN